MIVILFYKILTHQIFPAYANSQRNLKYFSFSYQKVYASFPRKLCYNKIFRLNKIDVFVEQKAPREDVEIA